MRTVEPKDGTILAADDLTEAWEALPPHIRDGVELAIVEQESPDA